MTAAMQKARSSLERMTEARDRCAGLASSGFATLAPTPITFDFPSPQAAADWLDANLGPCPPDGQLRRIDQNKGYAPGNLRWLIVPRAAPNKPARKPSAARQKYLAYLGSEAWSIRRDFALEAAGYACSLCSSTDRLDVHHRTYERLYAERLADLTVLCRKCHGKFHEILPASP